VDEVRIVTVASDGKTRHRTIIWVVVDERDRVLIRSVRGGVGRWYREARRQPDVALEVDGMDRAVTAVPAGDPERIDACSRALRNKYELSQSLRSMLRAGVLDTTLELRPRAGDR
jgi:hypothetical protein